MARLATRLGGIFFAALAGASIFAPGCSSESADQAPPSTEWAGSPRVGEISQAATGVCDSAPPTTTTACINQIQSLGGQVYNDIFRDTKGRTGAQLPVFGKLFNVWPGCNTTSWAGCAGQSNPPYDCPGQYTCLSKPNTFANAAAHLNALDRLWWHPVRPTTNGMTGACPNWSPYAGDGTGGYFYPWYGLVFDLGGPSNKVVIFAENDHGPQPCESLEYTVFLTDNPFSKEIIQYPTTTGADPNKWNRAVLSQIFTEGFVRVRPAGQVNAGCGDTAQYAVEEDSFVQVFSMPCGINFRYAAIVAGNDGLDFDKCAYFSSEAELDAVAGLTEDGTAVCNDADGDLFVDCNCPGAPAVCDCNDGDPNIFPGAPEACDDPDKSCDGKAGGCEGGLTCYQKQCLNGCDGTCPLGSQCTGTPAGPLCVPSDCTSGACPPGSSCDAVSKTCKPACDTVVCPHGQVCKAGACIDLCKGVTCPNQQICNNGKCQPRCSCFSGDVGCTPGDVCDKGNSNLCVPPACKGVTCAAGEHCNAAGQCVGFCDGVVCPIDSNPCTSDSCDLALGCGHYVVNDGTPCPNASVCDGAESCLAGTCVPGAPLFCDDGNPCTTDSCDSVAGCVTALEPDGTLCVDGKACNGDETCQAGTCTPLPGFNCDDNDPCTVDNCDDINGCFHVPKFQGSSCSDGNPCNGDETCDASGACVAGPPGDPDDGNPCTLDACDPQGGVTHTPVAAGTSCSNGNVCDGTETCDDNGACVAADPLPVDDGDPCTVDACDPVSGNITHTPAADGASCADGNACNGDETCQAGACVNGVAPSCDDGVACTFDACNPLTGCVHDSTGCGGAGQGGSGQGGSGQGGSAQGGSSQGGSAQGGSAQGGNGASGGTATGGAAGSSAGGASAGGQGGSSAGGAGGSSAGGSSAGGSSAGGASAGGASAGGASAGGASAGGASAGGASAGGAAQGGKGGVTGAGGKAGSSAGGASAGGSSAGGASASGGKAGQTGSGTGSAGKDAGATGGSSSGATGGSSSKPGGDAAAAPTDAAAEDTGGCGCETVGQQPRGAASLSLLGLGLAIAAASRRRRR